MEEKKKKRKIIEAVVVVVVLGLVAVSWALFSRNNKTPNKGQLIYQDF